MHKVAIRRIVGPTVLAALAAGAQAVVVGQIDDFEDGTTQNWGVSLLGQPHPAPPVNIATGGPQGADDNFLQLTSVGGTVAGSRMVALNPAQWSGDYTGAGVTSIRLWARNLGDTDLTLRLMFEDAGGGPPNNIAVSTNGASLTAGSGWQMVELGTTAADLTGLLGSVETVLSNTTILRLYSGETATFPPAPIAGLLGVDDIQAVPEPATLAALGLGAAAMLRRRRRG